MYMRYLTRTCFVLLLTIGACDQGNVPREHLFNDYVLFIRQGAGDKIFIIKPTQSANAIELSVSRYQFREVSMTMRCIRDSSNREAFDVFAAAIGCQYDLFGDFRQPSEPTGTWVSMYMVRVPEQVEITNTSLRNALFYFESYVDDRMRLSQ